jgi:hypothetical protein
MKKFVSSFITFGPVALTLASGVALAATCYTLFGDAHFISPGNDSPRAVEAHATESGTFGGVDFSVPAGLTLSDLDILQTDYKFTQGSCSGGSPRFSVEVTNGTVTGTIFFYIGPPPNYTGCPANVWTSSGNLALPTNLVDTSQLPLGTFYDPYAAAQTKYGSYTVLSTALVVDTFSPLGDKTVQFDNTQINDTIYTYESAQSCKHGGWEDLSGQNGFPVFKNQGACVSYFQHHPEGQTCN